MTFPPLHAPVEWWRAYVEERLAGRGRGEAIEGANRRGLVARRSWMRFRIAGATVLTLPVAGGASALKNRPPHTWTMAREARRENRKIAATLATIYGREPYFHLIADQLPPVAESCEPEGLKASEVCREAFGRIERLLGLADEGLLASLREGMAAGDAILREAGSRHGMLMEPGMSIVDGIVRLGPDAIFGLIPSF